MSSVQPQTHGAAAAAATVPLVRHFTTCTQLDQIGSLADGYNGITFVIFHRKLFQRSLFNVLPNGSTQALQLIEHPASFSCQ